jgi:hypothetical protein
VASVIFAPDDDHYTVRFDYDREVVAILEDIPDFARKWWPASRSWWIFGYYAGYLASELDAHGHTVIGLDPTHWRRHGGEHSAQHNSYAGDDWAKALFARVGPERADAVFKALTRVLHPDNQDSGDGRLQQELNDAYSELQPTQEATS